jgi:pentatricopeptide repeat protein
MRVWVSCLLSSSESLYVSAISNCPRHTLIVVYVTQKEGVLHLWPKVTNELKVLPDEGCAIEVLHTAGRHGLPELAMDVLRVLKVIGVDLREHHFAPIIESFCRTNRIKEALSTLNLIRQHNIEPNFDTAHSIFEAIRASPDAVDAAWDALEALHSEGQTVDVTAINVVIHASVALGDLQRAFGTYQMCSELKIKPTLDTYHFLLSGCIAARHRELGNRLIAEMKEAKIKPDARTYERLIVLCLTGETYEDAFFYLEEMKAENLFPPLSIYEAIIKRCVLEKDARYAVAVKELEEFGYRVSLELSKIISEEGGSGHSKTERGPP